MCFFCENFGIYWCINNNNTITINTTDTIDTITTTRAPDIGVFAFGCTGCCGGIERGFGNIWLVNQ